MRQADMSDYDIPPAPSSSPQSATPAFEMYKTPYAASERSNPLIYSNASPTFGFEDLHLSGVDDPMVNSADFGSDSGVKGEPHKAYEARLKRVGHTISDEALSTTRIPRSKPLPPPGMDWDSVMGGFKPKSDSTAGLQSRPFRGWDELLQESNGSELGVSDNFDHVEEDLPGQQMGTGGLHSSLPVSKSKPAHFSKYINWEGLKNVYHSRLSSASTSMSRAESEMASASDEVEGGGDPSGEWKALSNVGTGADYNGGWYSNASGRNSPMPGALNSDCPRYNRRRNNQRGNNGPMPSTPENKITWPTVENASHVENTQDHAWGRRSCISPPSSTVGNDSEPLASSLATGAGLRVKQLEAAPALSTGTDSKGKSVLDGFSRTIGEPGAATAEARGPAIGAAPGVPDKLEYLRRCIDSTSISSDDRYKALGVLSTLTRGGQSGDVLCGSAGIISPTTTLQQYSNQAAALLSFQHTQSTSPLEKQMMGMSREITKMQAYQKFQREQQITERLARIDSRLATSGGADRVTAFQKRTAREVEKLSLRVSELMKTPGQGNRSDVGGQLQEQKVSPENKRKSMENGGSVTAEFQLPDGSWENHVLRVARIVEGVAAPVTGQAKTGGSNLIGFLEWTNGHKTQHPMKALRIKCPQKLLEYYEAHL